VTGDPTEPFDDAAVPEAELVPFDEPSASPGPGTDLAPMAPPASPPGVLDLVFRSARLGVDAAALMAGEVADLSVRVARSVLPPAVADRPLGAVDERLGRQRTAARERGEQSVEQTKEAAEAVLNQVVVGVVDMLDMETLIDHVPIDKIVGRVDVAAIVNEVDLGDIVRESTTGLVGETVDAVRVQVMGLDLFAARIVDKILRRKEPRDLTLEGYDVFGSEIRVPREMR
jgi:hypothetical protein